VRIIFWGTPEYSVPSLDIIIKSEHDVLAVISQPDKKRSRGNKLISSPVKKFSENRNIPTYTPEVIKGNDEFFKEINELSCDLFIVVAYGKILPKEILEIPKYGSWNAHGSLLPRWRGAAPIQWALMEGDNYTGVGIMKMEEGLDTGGVLVEEKIKIDPEDNLFSLSQKLSLLSARLFINAIHKLENNNNIDEYLTDQRKLGRKIKYARMIQKNDFKINWDDDAINIFRKINALYPRAYSIFRGKNIKIIKIRVLKDHEYNIEKNKYSCSNSKSGYVVAIKENEGIVISTNTQPIILLEAKLEGKNSSSKMKLIQQLSPIIGESFLC